MEEIIISREVRTFLKELTKVLHQKEYFGFIETADAYVNNLIDAILQIPIVTHYETPSELRKYGKFYVKIKGSKRTMWYVFFDKSENRYLIEFIPKSRK